MRSIRVHFQHDLRIGEELDLPAPVHAHAVRVLRLRAGDALMLFNGDGNDYAAELTRIDARGARVRVLASKVVDCESPLRLTLAQGLARGEKMDWVVQKATELGVSAIQPLVTERSEVRLDEARADKRLSHWRAIAASACEQCGRARLPAIAAPMSLQSWLTMLETDTRARFVLLPDGESRIRDRDATVAEATIAIGPEGGFGDRDVAALRAASFRGLRLGPRVLRTETAGIAAIAALQALYGDF